MAEKIVLINPIAFDLARNSKGTIICGPGTAKACDQAMRFARAQENALILVSAADAGVKWDSVNMWEVMREYLLAHDWTAIYAREALSFDTIGEVMAAAHAIKTLHRSRASDSVEKMVFVVKEWHANRVQAIAKLVWELEGLTVPVQVETHPLPAAPWVVYAEPFKTYRSLALVQKEYDRANSYSGGRA